MKKQDKDMVVTIALIAGSLIVLLGGVFAKEIGQEGKAIFMIMCSLYLAMWVHAGIVASRINAKLEDKKEEKSNSGAVEKSASRN